MSIWCVEEYYYRTNYLFESVILNVKEINALTTLVQNFPWSYQAEVSLKS